MIAEAVKKIQGEIKESKNPYVEVVGAFLLQHLETNPESAEKIANKDKSIIKSLDEMRKAAEKKKIGNCAVLTDEEGFEIVLKYFGIEEEKGPKVIQMVKEEVNKKDNIDFDVKLEDFI